ncbi:GL18271 [Drosophila persimilis]|uniref:GL18271 n=1 Tax=Drosophila persimilis TaxID=7234 RepID=B4H4P6_DROPE|nr:GL18271 [Drosophila persimilis]
MCPPIYPPDVSSPQQTVIQNIRNIQLGGIFRQLLLDLNRPATLDDITGWLVQRNREEQEQQEPGRSSSSSNKDIVILIATLKMKFF